MLLALQSMPDGLLVTKPPPLPASATVKVETGPMKLPNAYENASDIGLPLTALVAVEITETLPA